MRKIYRICFYPAAVIIILFGFVQYMQNLGYNYMVIENSTSDSIVKDGTLLIFKECDIKDLKEYDIIRLDSEEDFIARILDVDRKNKSLHISAEEFSNNAKKIGIEACMGKLVFHLNDYKTLYQKYITPNRHLLLAIPIILSDLGMFFLSMDRLRINNEDTEFMYHSRLSESQGGKPDKDSLPEGIYMKKPEN